METILENKISQDNTSENIETKANINKIKSFYNLKIIFSFLCEKKKLNMIIYNKKY